MSQTSNSSTKNAPDSIEKRSARRRSRIVANRARSFAEAERWDLEYWQERTPEEILQLGLPPNRIDRPLHQEGVRILEAVRERSKNEE